MTKGDPGYWPPPTRDDNVAQSETALTNQLIAVVNSVGNEAFVGETEKKDCSQTDNDRFRKKGRLDIVQLKPQFTLPCKTVYKLQIRDSCVFGAEEGLFEMIWLPIFV